MNIHLALIITLIQTFLSMDLSSSQFTDNNCMNVNCSCMLFNSNWSTSYNVCPSNVNQCFKTAKCSMIRWRCSFLLNNYLRECLNKTNYCVVGGCSNELCLEATSSVSSPCIWKPQFECYKTAQCEVQTDGQCRWTKTTELNNCLSTYNTPTS